MLQAVHLRGETHITARELRATLVYTLFGIHYCRDYHDGTTGKEFRPWWDRAFDPQSPRRQGEVLRELIRFDPALESHPKIDRYLRRTEAKVGQGVPHYPCLSLASARRRAWFEWAGDDIAAVTSDAADPGLDLAQGQHLREFRELSIQSEANAELCCKLCAGISRLEGLPPQALDQSGTVPLRITPRTPTETVFWIEKRLTDFRLEADLPPVAEGVDRLHRQAVLIYRYRDEREERLYLGAELFHLLLELNDGYQLGDVSTSDTFVRLSIFVRRLVREDDRRLLAWNPMDEERIYRVSADIEDGDQGARQRLIISRSQAADHGG